jgi:hypothetical protein
VSTDPYAHLDAAYVLGALDPVERADFEAHLATCLGCQQAVADLAELPSLLEGFDEGVFTDDDVEGAPDTLLPGLLRAARRERTRQRWITAGLGTAAAACLTAVLVTTLPSGGTTTAAPPPRPLTALVTSPVVATAALRSTAWGTEIDLSCWYQAGAAVSPGYRYQLVAYDDDGDSYVVGSWRLDPGTRVEFTGGVALDRNEIKSLKITMPDGTPILALTV